MASGYRLNDTFTGINLFARFTVVAYNKKDEVLIFVLSIKDKRLIWFT